MLDFLKTKKSKNLKISDLAVQTCSSINNNFGHPFDEIQKYKPLTVPEIKLYRALREAVPIIDAAISKIIRLTGEFKIKSDNLELEYSLNKFIDNVQVNSCERGANSFILSHLNQLLTYGTAVGEIVINPENNSIQALYNACLSDVVLTTKNSPLDLLVLRKKYNNNNYDFEPVKYPELVLISSLNPEPGNIYGNSIMKGLPFVSNILLKIFHSIGVNWERIGNIRFAVTYKPGDSNGEKIYSKERASQIASEWSKAMSDSKHPSDFIAIGDVQVKVIGADNQILESQVPVRQMLEQIVSKLSIPPFLLGLSWSTTETMSSQQSEILSSELESYRRLLNPIIKKICDMYLRLNNYQSNYEIVWEKIDLKDQLQSANSRFINAKAHEIEKRLENQEYLK